MSTATNTQLDSVRYPKTPSSELTPGFEFSFNSALEDLRESLGMHLTVRLSQVENLNRVDFFARGDVYLGAPEDGQRLGSLNIDQTPAGMMATLHGDGPTEQMLGSARLEDIATGLKPGFAKLFSENEVQRAARKLMGAEAEQPVQPQSASASTADSFSAVKAKPVSYSAISDLLSELRQGVIHPGRLFELSDKALDSVSEELMALRASQDTAHEAWSMLDALEKGVENGNVQLPSSVDPQKAFASLANRMTDVEPEYAPPYESIGWIMDSARNGDLQSQKLFVEQATLNRLRTELTALLSDRATFSDAEDALMGVDSASVHVTDAEDSAVAVERFFDAVYAALKNARQATGNR